MSDSKNGHGFSTMAIHAGEHPDPATHAHNTPIYQTSTYAFESLDDKFAVLNQEKPGHLYTRMSNPTTAALEAKIAAMEGAEASLAGASGMAVISAALLTLLKSGDHVVAADEIYHYADDFLREDAAAYGIEFSTVDFADLDAVRRAIRPETKVLYCEFISNPSLKVADIPALAGIANEHGLTMIVDNTFCSPYLFRPLEHGVHLSLHSATKYICGHGNAIAGVISGDAERIKAIHKKLILLGSCISPFNAWLLLQGVKTLELRMERHCHNALELARFLDRQPEVKKVNYPGLPSHPGHDIVKQHMNGHFGGMVSFELDDGLDAANYLANALRICDHGVSLGDVSTLVWPTEGEQLVRVSVGCENTDDLVGDFEQALESLRSATQGVAGHDLSAVGQRRKS